MVLVEFKEVTKDYMDGEEVVNALQETSFQISEGEFVAIIGPSGSGKSTMLTLMGGLQSPSSGSIYINHKCLSDLNEKAKAKLRFDEIGFVLQSSNLVPYLTIAQQFQLVAKFSKTKLDQARSQSLMEDLNILHLKDKYPNDLSGGERQRAAICRALYPNPSLILADEPTASLDSNKAFAVVELLRSATKKQNKSTVMVTHDERLLTYCDRVFVITDGKLEERY